MNSLIVDSLSVESNLLKTRAEQLKEQVSSLNQDLSVLISCYHQLQLCGADFSRQPAACSRSRDKVVESRRNEVDIETGALNLKCFPIRKMMR